MVNGCVCFQAQNALEDMSTRVPRANLTYYVNLKTLQTIYHALDIPMPNFGGDKMSNGFHLANGEEEEGEVVEEDVMDEVGD